MRAAFTGSTFSRARKCPASAVLPRYRREYSDRVGTATHAHLALRVTHGVDSAVAAIPDLALRHRLDEREAGIFRARCMSFDFTPPRGAVAEVALALFNDGSVKPIEGGRGEYELPDGAIFAITIDALYSEPEPLVWVEESPVCPDGSILHVLDYKTGLPQYTEAVEYNEQAHAAALVAARWTKAEQVRPSLVYVRKGEGLWDSLAHWLGERELSAVEAEIRKTFGRVERQRVRLGAGDRLDDIVEGPQCEFCEAERACPAKTSTLAELVGAEPLPEGEPLTVGMLGKLLALAPSLKRKLDQIEAAARAHVESSGEPIPLGPGKFWGPHPHQKKVLHPFKGYALLRDEVGEDLAREAMRVEISREGMRRAVVKHQEATGAPIDPEPVVRRIFGRAIGAGALTEETSTWWSTYTDGAREPVSAETRVARPEPRRVRTPPAVLPPREPPKAPPVQLEPFSVPPATAGNVIPFMRRPSPAQSTTQQGAPRRTWKAGDKT